MSSHLIGSVLQIHQYIQLVNTISLIDMKETNLAYLIVYANPLLS